MKRVANRKSNKKEDKLFRFFELLLIANKNNQQREIRRTKQAKASSTD
tara:strand:- start:225 stop:368 length:144 start_codon:yes stop_codon:yes gene_type:complete